MSAQENQEKRFEQLARTNPLFGSNKLKLGIFGSNMSAGASLSTMDGILQLNWPNTAHLARLADDMKFEAVVPAARWRGFGGESDPNSETFETMTWAAAMAASTRYPSTFATVHVPTLMPAMAAKQSATIDHISGGRFTLNVTMGWNTAEMNLFGGGMLDHDDRYEAGTEWITLLKRIWTEEEAFDFDGKFYQAKDVYLRPRPIQPYPALMAAGASSRGRLFAAEHADVAFTAMSKRDPDSMRANVEDYLKLAWDNFGRKMSIWATANVVIGDTDEDAQRLFDHCVAKGDQVAVDNLFSSLNITNQSLKPEILQMLRQDFIVGWGGIRIVGSKESIVDQMKQLVDVGLDGVLLTFPNYMEGMERFKEEVHPLLVEAGLR